MCFSFLLPCLCKVFFVKEFSDNDGWQWSFRRTLLCFLCRVSVRRILRVSFPLVDELADMVAVLFDGGGFGLFVPFVTMGLMFRFSVKRLIL